MHESPYKGREAFDFDDRSIKVLCLTSPETVRGLQWALDRGGFSDRRFQLFSAGLSQIDSAADELEHDIALVTIDLGQPVPVEHLRRLREGPGLAVFLHPTPQQLLSLGDLPRWIPLAWDGVGYERLAQKLDELASRYEKDIQTGQFLETCKAWMRRSEEMVDNIEWLNPPDGYRGQKLLTLDATRGLITIGGLTSGCDLAMDLGKAVDSRAEIGEFRFINGQWGFKEFGEPGRVEIRAAKADRLRPGDQVEILGFTLQLRRAPKVEEILRIARKFGHFLEVPTSGLLGEKLRDRTVADVCKELIYSGLKCELRLNSGLKNGSIYFEDGAISSALTGSVSGKKALLRMLGWESPSWRLNVDRLPQPGTALMRLGLTEFTKVYQAWRKSWTRVAALVPPLQLRLRANPQAYLRKTSWTPSEGRVLASLCEYGMVRDILNSCQLNDVEIIETLILMRKQGLVEPVKTT